MSATTGRINMPAVKARADMEEKFDWASQSNTIVQHQVSILKDISPNSVGSIELLAVKQAFWAFLEAYYQIRAYQGAWAKSATGKAGQGNILLDKWKARFLTTDQLATWEVLASIRNDNAHRNLVLPDVCIRHAIRSIHGGRVRVTHDGSVRGAKVQYLAVSQNEIDYDLMQLTANGLVLLRQFIDTFDQVNL